jgi:guanosine-3',5'-bis(diphosphate) 3'-pyrophosphohydrolase
VNPPPAAASPGSAGADPVAGLLRIVAGTRPGADAGLIRRAYQVAAHWHRGQRRTSGEPYISHPLAVATIAAEVGADDPTVCAALLHDTLEGTSYTLAALAGEFGAEIAHLVGGAMAADTPGGELALPHPGPAGAAAAPGDARILVIKLADRLHNMRTVRHLPPAMQVQTSRQTLETSVPLARRLGLGAIRSELENLASDALKRYGPRAAMVSGRLLAAASALLPAATRTRWCQEWLGELSVLPTRRARVSFAAQTLLGMARLAVILHRPAGSKQEPRQ